MAGVVSQNLEKMGNYLPMTKESDVTTVVNAVKLNGVYNKISLSSIAFGNGTINLLVQIPKDDDLFAGYNLLAPTFVSTIAPTIGLNIKLFIFKFSI